MADTSLKRIFSAIRPEAGKELPLSDQDAHHLLNVLRMEPGRRLIVAYGGKDYDAIIVRAEAPATVKILTERPTRQPKGCVASLSFALSKGKKNDLVCEKATELGVEHLFFWEAERSVVRLRTAEDRAAKAKRLKKIAESAAKQSGKSDTPTVAVPANLEELIEEINKVASTRDVLACCSLSPEAVALKKIGPIENRVHLVVGPEGDLTPKEEWALTKHGFQLASLGPFVLRAETAAITAVAMAQGLWGPERD